MAAIPKSNNKTRGEELGDFVATKILKARKNDGTANNTPYVPGQLPGNHRVDPLNPNQGFLTPNWGDVKPFGILENFYGTNNIAFTFTSDELNGVTTDNLGNVRPLAPRSFNTLSDATWENAVSRIYLGIHWIFDAEWGVVGGMQVADYVFDNVLELED